MSTPKKKYFGTDGIRGIANGPKMNPELCYQLGLAAGQLLAESGETRRVVMGRDSRKSGTMLGAALAAGFCAAGIEVLSLGIVPTGLISYVVRTGDFGLGVVISASHNPAPDNGVKLFAHNGRKVTDEFELEIESILGKSPANPPTGGEVGAINQDKAEIERYMQFLESTCPERLEGLKVTVDAANGAAYELGPEILRRLGAEVIALGTTPDGMNINEEGGATKTGPLQELSQNEHATIGIAFDGDADRAVFSDDQGRLINGDRMMAIWSSFWREKGKFDPPIVVGTVMSNAGFENYLAANNIQLTRADVGDKYVFAAMHETGAKIGGEQSGHIIIADRGPTGDGLITAIELCRVLKQSGKTAAQWFDAFDNVPQVLVNVTVTSKEAFRDSAPVRAAIQTAEETIGDTGRVNIRASGTQDMVRIMVESTDLDRRDRAAAAVVDAMREHVGGAIYSRVDLTHELGD